MSKNVSTIAAALAAMASGCGIGGVLIKLGREVATRNDLLQQKEEMKTEISEMKKEIARWHENRIKSNERICVPWALSVCLPSTIK